MGRAAAVVGVAVALAIVAGVADAMNFKMKASSEMCFHELAHRGNKVLAVYDVVSWGYGAYATLKVSAPSSAVLKTIENQGEGRAEFYAEEDGEYTFCFKNGNALTEISFYVNLERDFGLSEVAKEEHVTDTMYSVDRLSSMINAAKIDLLSLKAKEGRHRKMAESNRRRVTFWATAECLLIVLVAVGQIIRIRKFFENKLSI